MLEITKDIHRRMKRELRNLLYGKKPHVYRSAVLGRGR
jgi:hypothetical protein